MTTHHLASKWLIGAIICLASGISFAERPMQILYFQAPNEAPTEAYIYANDAMLMKTDLPRSNFSKSIEIPKGSIQLQFLAEPVEEGSKVPREAPLVTIPEGWSKILLLVFEGEIDAIMPIRVRAINASDDVFGPGSIHVINFSDIRIGGRIGDKIIDLHPHKTKTIKHPIKNNGYYPTKLQAITKEGEKPQWFIKQMWEHNESTRNVLFILAKPAPLHATYYCAPIRDL
jgi:hypothetical protein